MRIAPSTLVTVGVWLLACGGTPQLRDGGTQSQDGEVPTDAPIALDGALDPDGGPALITVGHERELRGAWVASVYGLTWPSETGLSETASRAEITAILDVLEELRLNAVFVQVRPESDALYPSELDPWSRWLTGTQGTDPGWDPLQAWIDEGHARGIEVHAWLNPYRGTTSTTAHRDSDHISVRYPEHAITWGSSILMDPGAAPVREHVVAVVRDIVSRYDVDGIHFDDYFYPYPSDSTPDVFPDDDTYGAYVDGGGALSRDDWRRDNVNTLVREVSEAIAAERDDVRFGISPFGIYRPGMPEGISGTDAYATLYCDAPHWIERGWVDYIAPQLYWPSTQAPQAFGPLIEWWAQRPRDPGRSIFAGMTLMRLDRPGWSRDEIRTQVELMRAQRESGARGSILYRADALLDDPMSLRALFRDELNLASVATPPLATAVDAAIDPPGVALEGTTLTLTPPAGVDVRAYAVYAQPSGELVRLLPAAEPSASLSTGAYAVSAIDRRGVESGGVPIDVP